MLYKFSELITKVLKDQNGTGVCFYYKDGTIERRFYEDFENDPGAERAERHSNGLFKAGKLSKVCYYYPDNLTGGVFCGEEIKIHFFDHLHREFSTKQDGVIYPVYAQDNKIGIEYLVGQFTPLENFCTNTGSVAFEIIS